jgi:hypothetical protein
MATRPKLLTIFWVSIQCFSSTLTPTPNYIPFDQRGGPTLDHSHAPTIIDELLTSLVPSFPQLGVNSRAELVPSSRAYAPNGARHRWLGN